MEDWKNKTWQRRQRWALRSDPTRWRVREESRNPKSDCRVIILEVIALIKNH